MSLAKCPFTLIIVLVAAGLFTAGCKIGENTKDPARESAELTAAYTTATVAGLSKTVPETGATLTSASANPGAQYNAVTGWWTVPVSLAGGQNVEINIQFLDENGSIQHFYQPATAKILAQGRGSGTSGEVAFDLDITGLGLTELERRINGSGSAIHMGNESTYEIKNMGMIKLQDGVPDSGQLVVVVSGITFTVNFNGSSEVQVSYRYGGEDHTFVIDIINGTVAG